MRKLKIAINGLGRIGRCVLRAYFENIKKYGQELEIVAINGGSGSIASKAHGIKYDSVHGTLPLNLSIIDHNKICVDDKHIINFLFEKNINNIDWSDFDIDIVLECTGKFNKHFDAHQHIKSGAKRVIVSSPYDGADNTIVLGANEEQLDLKKDYAISIGSCTTNCLAPIVKILDSNVGIESGFMTTIHAYTNDQLILDGSHQDKRRSRAAALSMIPSSTGAAKSLGLILPGLNGKISGSSVRVPVPNVSMIDLKFLSKTTTTKNAINDIMQTASSFMPQIIEICSEELVSCDFNHNSHSAIFDQTLTSVVNNNFCRVVAWYDNEWGFSNRMLDLAMLLYKK